MLKRGVLLTAFCLVNFGAGAQAATGKATGRVSVTTDRVDIVLKGYCNDVSEVSVVMDGREDEAFPAAVDPQDRCHWTATRKLGTFDTEFAQFSLRLGVARTTCQNADGDARNHVARLVFKCCKTEARLVEIQTPDEIAISYVRGVPQDLAYDDRSVGCVETYPFLALPIKIHSVWLPPAALSGVRPPVFRRAAASFETVWIQFDKKANPEAPGLIINDVTVTQYLKKGPSLNVEQIRAALFAQRSQGRAGMPPHCPPNADEAYRETFKKKPPMKSVNVTLSEK
jgi:hypothetical protein